MGKKSCFETLDETCMANPSRQVRSHDLGGIEEYSGLFNRPILHHGFELDFNSISNSILIFMMYFLLGSHITSTFVIFKSFPAAKFALCVQKQGALLFRRQSKDVWRLLKFRVESIHFK